MTEERACGVRGVSVSSWVGWVNILRPPSPSYREGQWWTACASERGRLRRSFGGGAGEPLGNASSLRGRRCAVVQQGGWHSKKMRHKY